MTAGAPEPVTLDAPAGGRAAPLLSPALDDDSGTFSSSSSDPSESSNAASISRAEDEVCVRCGRGEAYEKEADEEDGREGGEAAEPDVDLAGDAGTFEYDIGARAKGGERADCSGRDVR
jgi:hypothetical protein